MLIKPDDLDAVIATLQGETVSAAMHPDHDLDDRSLRDAPTTTTSRRGRPTPVVVRRNAGLAALVGAGASAIAIAYLWRATAVRRAAGLGACLVMAAIAALLPRATSSTPAPRCWSPTTSGVRIRLGNQWRGLPWDAVDRVVVQPRRGLLRDGRLMFAPHSLTRALDGLDAARPPRRRA